MSMGFHARTTGFASFSRRVARQRKSIPRQSSAFARSGAGARSRLGRENSGNNNVQREKKSSDLDSVIPIDLDTVSRMIKTVSLSMLLTMVGLVGQPIALTQQSSSSVNSLAQTIGNNFLSQRELVQIGGVPNMRLGFGIPAAEAILSNPNAGMARSASAALRRAVPVTNPKVGELQSDLERAQYLLRFPNRKPWSQMNTIAQQCLIKIEQDKSSIMQGVPSQKLPEAEVVVKGIVEALDGMQMSLAAQDSDRTATYLSRALKGTSDLEVLQCPNLPYVIPPAYAKLPKLQGRAALSIQFRGVTSPVDIIVDGYSAPLTGGNFLDNVKNGVYEGSKITIADKTTMFVRPMKSPDKGPLPLEVRLKDEFLPDYRQSLDVTNGDYPALPLSIYGALAMTHGQDETLNAPAEFFIYKFDRASMGGLGGLSFEEGQFSVFGYVMEDSHDTLEAVKDGAVIESIKILRGEDNLVLPASSQ